MLQDSFNPYCYLLSTFFVSPRTNHIFLKVTSIRPLPEVVGIPVAAFVIQLLASGLGKAAEAGPIACASAPTWKTWKKILPMSLEQISSGWSLQPFVEWTCIWKASHCLSFYKTFFWNENRYIFFKKSPLPNFPICSSLSLRCEDSILWTTSAEFLPCSQHTCTAGSTPVDASLLFLLDHQYVIHLSPIRFLFSNLLYDFSTSLTPEHVAVFQEASFLYFIIICFLLFAHPKAAVILYWTFCIQFYSYNQIWISSFLFWLI